MTGSLTNATDYADPKWTLRDELALRFAVAFAKGSADALGGTVHSTVWAGAYSAADAFLAERERQRGVKP
ncbi:MAG: hypothetical protein L3K06_08060 [Thermoplasmata archaeon]|nr:hypothetical protein [Thermoplasmata archaeon]